MLLSHHANVKPRNMSGPFFCSAFWSMERVWTRGLMFQWLVSFCIILASMPSEPLVKLRFFNWKTELVHFKQDLGPQFPSDITKMLKYGANIIQAVGYFNGILGYCAMLS
jgi:hypothetical protein